jgi:hypothetical protein
LHSLQEPGAALDEIDRGLRSGGGAYISLHPVTSATGCLDPRIHTSRRHEVQGWPYLRPKLREGLQSPNVYLNRLRLEDWRSLFASKMPGAEYILIESDNSATLEAARRLRREGELLEYALEELVAGEFAAVWKKPDFKLIGQKHIASIAIHDPACPGVAADNHFK